MSSNSEENELTKDLYSLIRKNSFYIFIERSIVPIINFLITIYVIRTLTVDDYGIYNILLAVMGYVGLFSSLGLPSIFQRYIPEFHEKRQIGKLNKLVERGLLWRFILCAIILLVTFLFSEQIGKLLKFRNASQYLTIFSIAVIFHLESGLLSTALTSVFHHKKYAIAQISYVLFRAGILYYLLSMGKGLVGFLIAESIAFGFLFVLQFFYYRKFLSMHVVEEKPGLPFKRLLRFGGFSYFSEIGAQILSVTTDYFVISAFLGPVAVGIYAFANRIMRQISHIMPQSMFINIIRPAFFTKFTQNKDTEQLNEMFNLLLKIIAFFVFPLVAGIIVLGDKLIIYVFDPKYLGSVKILWVVAIFTALNFFIIPTGLVLQSLEEIKIIFYSKIFAVYNLIADILVIKAYGVLGVALVTGSAVFGKNIFLYLFARKHAHLTADFKGLVIILLNSLILIFVLYPLRMLIINVPSFILVTLLGISIYVGAAYLNKAFSEKERIVINQILPRSVFVF